MVTRTIFLLLSMLFITSVSADVTLHSDDYHNDDYDFVRNGVNYRIKRTRGAGSTRELTDSVQIISGEPNADGVLSIPSYVNFTGKKFMVYDIAGSFNGCTALKQVILPPTITEIGYQAFYRCTNIEHVIFNEGLTELGFRAFGGCTKLKSISLPKSLRVIGSSAFEGCKSLTQVIVPENVIEIQLFAFSECSNLEKVVLHKALTRLNGTPFTKCKKLRTIICHAPIPPKGAPFLDSKDYSRVTLYVPDSAIEQYRNDKDWCKFSKILPL